MKGQRGLDSAVLSSGICTHFLRLWNSHLWCMRQLVYCVLVCCGMALLACQAAGSVRGTQKGRRLCRSIAESPVFSDHYTGFALYDPSNGKWLCQYNAGKYFTPASNTKILTLLTLLQTLGDSVETLRYAVIGDDLVFHGMADPSFLYAHAQDLLTSV